MILVSRTITKKAKRTMFVLLQKCKKGIYECYEVNPFLFGIGFICFFYHYR